MCVWCNILSSKLNNNSLHWIWNIDPHFSHNANRKLNYIVSQNKANHCCLFYPLGRIKLKHLRQNFCIAANTFFCLHARLFFSRPNSLNTKRKYKSAVLNKLSCICFNCNKTDYHIESIFGCL
jgi:hypothetical protein